MQLIATRCTPGDFETFLDHVEESLYRNVNGKYYIKAKGGPLSPYGKLDKASGMWLPGERTVNVTYDEAYEWASRVMERDAFQEAFGLKTVGVGQRSLSTKIKVSTQRALRRVADRQGLSIGQAIDYLVETVLLCDDDENEES